VAKWLTRWSAKPVFAGSIPARCSIEWAVEQLAQALEAGGISVTRASRIEDASQGSFCIIAAGAGTASAPDAAGREAYYSGDPESHGSDQAATPRQPKCMNFTGKKCRAHDPWQDKSTSNRFHGCHALMGLKANAKSRTATLPVWGSGSLFLRCLDKGGNRQYRIVRTSIRISAGHRSAE
jgi:hypothetical protein